MSEIVKQPRSYNVQPSLLGKDLLMLSALGRIQQIEGRDIIEVNGEVYKVPPYVKGFENKHLRKHRINVLADIVLCNIQDAELAKTCLTVSDALKQADNSPRRQPSGIVIRGH